MLQLMQRKTDEKVKKRKEPEEASSPEMGLHLEMSSDGRLLLKQEKKLVSVSVRRCFPWSEPEKFLSLRNEEGEEMALIESLEDLPLFSREALRHALKEAAFLFQIVKIMKIEEEFELRTWKVETKQGPREFQTALNVWPREMAGGGLLIQDLWGDLYFVEDPAQLEASSQKLLWAFMDED